MVQTIISWLYAMSTLSKILNENEVVAEALIDLLRLVLCFNAK